MSQLASHGHCARQRVDLATAEGVSGVCLLCARATESKRREAGQRDVDVTGSSPARIVHAASQISPAGAGTGQVLAMTSSIAVPTSRSHRSPPSSIVRNYPRVHDTSDHQTLRSSTVNIKWSLVFFSLVAVDHAKPATHASQQPNNYSRTDSTGLSMACCNLGTDALNGSPKCV